MNNMLDKFMAVATKMTGQRHLTVIRDGFISFIPSNIITERFFDMIRIGEAGVTLIVAIILSVRAHSNQYREIGKSSVLPGFFNINEPILFGIPR